MELLAQQGFREVMCVVMCVVSCVVSCVVMCLPLLMCTPNASTNNGRRWNV
jgi:hypothetical protein